MIQTKYNSNNDRPKGIDLFCGAGGMSLGFLMAGGEPIAAVDNDKDSIDTYQSIFPNSKPHLGKIEQWKPGNKLKNTDVIIGGPPCQGFSIARGLRFVDDPRNQLYKDFVRIVKNYNPKWFVMENVTGILSIGKGKVLQNILEDFYNIGYAVDYKLVNMAEYGVPQLRKRAIFVGNKHKEKFEWPERLYSKRTKELDLFKNDIPSYISVNDALGDLHLPIGSYFAHRANSQMRGPRNRDAYKEPAFTLRVRGDEFALCEKPAESAFIPGASPDEDFSYLPEENSIQNYFRQKPPTWIKQKPIKSKRDEKVYLKGTR